MGEKADIGNSAVARGCTLLGEVKNSVISTGTTVGEGASVTYSVVMPGAVIEDGAQVHYAIVGEKCHIGAGAVVGAPPEQAEDPEQWGIAVLGPRTCVAAGEKVAPKTMLDKNH